MFLPFAIDLNGSFHNDKSFHLISENIFWLSAFLNSKLFKYCFNDNFPALGEKGREIRKVFFEQIPVKQVSPEIEEKFKTLISQILEIKKSGLDTHDLEVQIDSLVYALYGLDEAEIRLIEGDKD